jgi:predicted ATP-grasp superfamily ATP-dependent carboligase
MIAQEYVAGRPASVAFLVGPRQVVSLLPTFQVLSADGRFRYEGGRLPIGPQLAERAIRVGAAAIRCVPGLFGYVGVDLILGERPGEPDVAVEINPRLTTSHVGLRAMADGNPAGWMLAVCEGRPADVRWKRGRIRLFPDGRIARDGVPPFWA